MGRVDVFPSQSNNKKENIIPWTNVFEKQSSPSEQGIIYFRVHHMLLDLLF